MRIYKIATLFLLYCTCAGSFAQVPHFSIAAGGGVQTNTLNWSIAGDWQGQSPNVLSELKFKRIVTAGAFATIQYRALKFLSICASYQKYGTLSGAVSDIDYNGDNRTHPVYNETFNSNKGYMHRFAAGILVHAFTTDRYGLQAGLQYVNTRQHYTLLESNDQRMNSWYFTKWGSVELSAGGEWYFNKRIVVNAAFAFALIGYNAMADWNMRRDFRHPVSFIQEANGKSMHIAFGLKHELNNKYHLFINGIAGRSTTQKGIDIAYLSNDTEVATQFNGAERNYGELKIGAGIDL